MSEIYLTQAILRNQRMVRILATERVVVRAHGAPGPRGLAGGTLVTTVDAGGAFTAAPSSGDLILDGGGASGV